MASAAGSPRKAAATSPKAEVQSLETGSVFSDQTSVQLLEVGDVVCLRAEAISEKEMKVKSLSTQVALTQAAAKLFTNNFCAEHHYPPGPGRSCGRRRFNCRRDLEVCNGKSLRLKLSVGGAVEVCGCMAGRKAFGSCRLRTLTSARMCNFG